LLRAWGVCHGPHGGWCLPCAAFMCCVGLTLPAPSQLFAGFTHLQPFKDYNSECAYCRADGKGRYAYVHSVARRWFLFGALCSHHAGWVQVRVQRIHAHCRRLRRYAVHKVGTP